MHRQVLATPSAPADPEGPGAPPREVLTGWCPGSDPEMDAGLRARKTTKFGATKFVFPADEMRLIRLTLEASPGRHLPDAAALSEPSAPT